jgi:3-oxoacyl-(acyl-carrier-protein) synthase
MRRVVVTGLGIVSCIGNNRLEVLESLKAGTSGIEYCEKYAELGFRSHVHGSVKLNVEDFLDRKVRRFLGDGAAYNFIAMQEAIDDSGFDYGFGRTVDQEPTLVLGYVARKISKTRRPVYGPSHDVEHQLSHTGDTVQD